MNRKTIICLLLSTFYIITASANSIKDTLTIITPFDAPPYCFTNQKGQYDGYIPNILSHIEKHIDKTIKIVPYDLNSILRESKYNDIVNNYDLYSFANPSIRIDSILFYSKPYFDMDFVVLSQEGKLYRNPSNITESKIILVRNSSAWFKIFILLRHSFENRPIIVDNFQEALKVLDEGKVDYFVTSAFLVGLYKKEIDKLDFAISNASLLPINVTMSSKNPHTIIEVNKAIRKLEEDGTIQRLKKEWLSFNIYKNDYKTYYTIIIIASIIGILMLIIIFINRHLIKRALKKAAIATQLNDELIESIKHLNASDDTKIYTFDVETKECKLVEDGRFIPFETEVFGKENLHPEDIEIHDKATNDFINLSEEIQRYTFRYLNSDKTLYNYYENLTIPLKKDGKVYKYTFSRRNVTQERLVKEKLMELRKTVQVALAVGSLSIWEYEREAQEMQILQGAEIFGGKMTLRKYSLHSHPDDINILPDALNAIFNNEKDKVQVKFRLKLDDSGYRWFICHMIPIYDENGIPIKVIGSRQDITEEMNMQLELTRRQDNLQAIIDRLPIPIYIKDAKTQVVSYINEASYQAYIKDKKKSIHDAFSKSTLEKFYEVDRDILLSGKDYISNESVELVNGEIKETFVKKILMNYNNKEQILVVRFDYTEKQKLEKAQQLLAVSLPAIKAFTWTLNNKDHILNYNSHYEGINLKMNEIDTLEKRAIHIHPEDKHEYLTNINNSLEKGEGEFYLTYRSCIYSQNEYEWWETRGISNTVTVDNHTYNIIYGISINIHKQKQSELALLEKQAELTELNRQNELILNNTSSGIIYLDNDYIVQWSNLDLMNMQAPDNHTYNVGERCYESRGKNEPCKDCFVHEALKNKRTAYKQYYVAERDKTYDSWATPILGKDGHSNEGVVIRVDDATERESLVKHLEQALTKAEESERLKMAFLANMSHEIRTPLNAIVGFSSLLQDEVSPEEKAQYIEIIEQNNENLLRLVGDILNLSKIESGATEINPTRFDLVNKLQSIYVEWLRKSDETGVKLLKEFPQTTCEVLIDDKAITQVTTNFISNAFKYTPSGSITLGYEIKETGVNIYVRDTGIGIRKDKQDEVFGRFSKLDSFAQGTGLGLYICHALMDACGGKIGFTSQEGEGSTFWAFFPSKTTLK